MNDQLQRVCEDFKKSFLHHLRSELPVSDDQKIPLIERLQRDFDLFKDIHVLSNEMFDSFTFFNVELSFLKCLQNAINRCTYLFYYSSLSNRNLIERILICLSSYRHNPFSLEYQSGMLSVEVAFFFISCFSYDYQRISITDCRTNIMNHIKSKLKLVFRYYDSSLFRSFDFMNGPKLVDCVVTGLNRCLTDGLYCCNKESHIEELYHAMFFIALLVFRTSFIEHLKSIDCVPFIKFRIKDSLFRYSRETVKGGLDFSVIELFLQKYSFDELKTQLLYSILNEFELC